jgi:hypothetical protein
MKSALKFVFGASADERTRRFFLALILILGFLQAWASRMDLVNDTVSYLDIGDSIWHGHLSMAVNGLWGPLYATILGVAVGIVHPSLYWEFPLVHLVVFALFLYALCGFDFLLRELILLRQEREVDGECRVPAWGWMAIGYTLFLWSSLELIQVSETNPDMLVAAFFYFAGGFLVKIHRGVAGWSAYVALGWVLGLGYLTKSIMFPVSLMCLAVALLISRRQVWRVAAAAAVFLAIAGPFVVALSVQKGRLTFGESGHYNYAVHVDGVPRTHWQGEIAGNGKPLHADRQIFDHPATFEFATPIAGTYPVWTDPSYWYDGLQTPLILRHVLAREAKLLHDETLFFFELHGGVIAALFVLFYVSGRKWVILRDISAFWFLILPALGTLCLYAMIHIEPRYLAPFIVTILLGLFFSVHLAACQQSQRLFSGVAIFLFLMFICPIESPSLHVREFVRDVLGQSKPDPNSYQAMASEMDRLGLRPGDRIASLEYSLWNTSTWARLSRVQIVAEVYFWPGLAETNGNDFWKADSDTQQKVVEAIQKTGAQVIISQAALVPSDAAGWQRVGNTNNYAYWLEPSLQKSPQKSTSLAPVAHNSPAR